MVYAIQCSSTVYRIMKARNFLAQNMIINLALYLLCDVKAVFVGHSQAQNVC